MRILVVDDDQLTRDGLRDLLRMEGHEVETACNGRSGLVSMRAGAPFDLVTLDIVMPDMDGEAVLGEMRGDPSLAKIPTLVLTASPRSEVTALEAKFPGLWVVQKPLDPNGLLGVVRRLEEKGLGSGGKG